MGPEFEHRGPATDEAIAGLAAGLATEYPVLDGPRWPASDVGLKPRPVQSPRPPIWVGGSSPAALRARRPVRRRLAPPVPRAERGALGHAAPDARGVPRTGRRSTSAASPTSSTWARRRPGSSCPRARWPDSPDQVAEYLRPFADGGRGPGTGAIPVPVGRRALRPDRRLRPGGRSPGRPLSRDPSVRRSHPPAARPGPGPGRRGRSGGGRRRHAVQGQTQLRQRDPGLSDICWSRRRPPPRRGTFDRPRRATTSAIDLDDRTAVSRPDPERHRRLG